MENVKGLFILLHNGFAKVNVEEALDALPKKWLQAQREVIEISYSEILKLDKLYNTGYGQFALEHQRQFTAEILPKLNAHPEYNIVYFGLAPIPLTIDLGYHFHNFRDIVIYQKHHVTKEWYLNLPKRKFPKNELSVEGMPDMEQKGITEALISLGISHSINLDDTRNVLPNAAEIEIKIREADEDAIETKEQMIALEEYIKSTFDGLSENRSGLEKIHLFASVNCGVAFMIGTKISPNIHSFIQTYQYSRTQDPKYKKALLIKALINEPRVVSKKEKKAAQSLRLKADKELRGKIKLYLEKNEEMSRARSWYIGIFPKLQETIFKGNFWRDLPALYETSLSEDSFDLTQDVINDGFNWMMNKWSVDDNFFISLAKRIKPSEDVLKAIRLFLFHEALHYKKHKITGETSLNIGSFPKVLETADYQADVYAIINEYGFAENTFGKIKDAREFFLNTIRVATETMWSFDDNGILLEEIQIRRLNRYLIWYWLYAQIEKEGKTMDDILRLFEQKPVIELNGLITKEENNRFFFELEVKKGQHLELGIFLNNELVRDGSASNLQIEALVQGVREMNGEKIIQVMKSLANR